MHEFSVYAQNLDTALSLLNKLLNELNFNDTYYCYVDTRKLNSPWALFINDFLGNKAIVEFPDLNICEEKFDTLTKLALKLNEKMFEMLRRNISKSTKDLEEKLTQDYIATERKFKMFKHRVSE